MDPTYKGFNLDDFMQAISAIATWNAKGRNKRHITVQDRINVMVESSFNTTKAHIDQIRNEIEVKRLELLTEKQNIDVEKAELAFHA